MATKTEKENKKVDKKQKRLNGKIKTVDCNVRLGEKSVLIDYQGITYITSKQLLTKLVYDELLTKEGKTSKSINMGIINDGEISNENESWLTKKGKAMYFAPRKDQVLIGSVDGFKELLSGAKDWLKLGIFQ